MENVYLVPGFMDTEIFLDSGLTALLWADPGSLVKGWEYVLRLAPNGIDPQPPDGQTVFAGNPTTASWNVVQRTLQLQIGSPDYNVVVHGWDWRKEITAAGDALSRRIREDVPDGRQCTIVGHSAGGLVALMCWIDLLQRNVQDRVRRIVTMGTPFQGSYGGPSILTRQNLEVGQLMAWNALLFGIGNFGVLPFPTRLWSWPTLFSLFATFPGWYELLPGLWGPLAASDPKRAFLYSRETYPPGYVVSQDWLDYSRLQFQRLLSNPANYPPSAVLTCVAGTGLDTVVGLRDELHLLDTGSYVSSRDGDSVVEAAAAILPTAATVTATCVHSSMPLSFTESGDLARWIVDPRRPPDPPPPPVELVQPFGELVTPTPPTDLFPGLRCIGGG